MNKYECRGCGENATNVANIVPTLRYASAIAVVDGSLAATLGEAEETDDLRRRFVWQCQRCGQEGYSRRGRA